MTWWRRQYIGTVTGRTRWKAGDRPLGVEETRWILSIRPFGLGRSAKRIGPAPLGGGSQQCQATYARVRAWLRGGPLPVLDSDTQMPKPAPLIRLASVREDAR